jgi:hypothetical protein
MSSSSKPARLWARSQFDCAMHQEEAAGFFDALLALWPGEIGDLDLDITLADWLVSTGRAPFPRKAPSAGLRQSLVSEALLEYVTRGRLLGPAAKACTWETDTLPARAIRAIINERVRHRGGCSCGSGSDDAG